MACAAVLAAGCAHTEWTMVTTTGDAPWVETRSGGRAAEAAELRDLGYTGAALRETVTVRIDAPRQTIQGFGVCFSELSWRALSRLSEADYNAVMTELFAPEGGAQFTICRMPIGASDFALKYYSFDDAPGDFAMERFTIENDLHTLIPLMRDALARNPALKIWGSPWTPPSWMKVNGHYACKPLRTAPDEAAGSSFPNRIFDNGLAPQNAIYEGQDGFIVEDEYLAAYALYFRKYIEAYREQGIDIYMVMPQNEFNSDQNFPSCTWTAKSLTRFLQHLVPAMEAEGVEVYLGTVERPNRMLVDSVLTDPVVGSAIRGVAFQWAGKDALPPIHESYPDLTMVMSEQECFGGANSWADFMAAWDLLKYNLDHGVSIYDYWNLALFDGEVSTWGWLQNSLISVDAATGAYRYNYEFYQMKHISGFVRPGAVCLTTEAGPVESTPQCPGEGTPPTETLAFRNPDGSIVVLAAVKGDTPREVTLRAGRKSARVVLPASSVSTIVLR